MAVSWGGMMQLQQHFLVRPSHCDHTLSRVRVRVRDLDRVKRDQPLEPWSDERALHVHPQRPLFTEDEFAEKFQLYEGVAEVVVRDCDVRPIAPAHNTSLTHGPLAHSRPTQALEKEYKKQHATYTQRLKKYEKSIRKERTRKAKQNSAALVSDVRLCDGGGLRLLSIPFGSH
jgi:hypothetical protein